MIKDKRGEAWLSGTQLDTAEDTVAEEAPAGVLGGRMLTIREVAQLLHCHPTSVRRWSDEGLLPCYRIGRRGDRRFRPEDVRRFVEASTANKDLVSL